MVQLRATLGLSSTTVAPVTAPGRRLGSSLPYAQLASDWTSGFPSALLAPTHDAARLVEALAKLSRVLTIGDKRSLRRRSAPRSMTPDVRS